ncbi:MAG: hypothetical protein R3E89_06595 [Thiolinea sp.]
MLSLFLGRITLVADISWVEVSEKVGDFILRLFERPQISVKKSAADRDAAAAGGGALTVSRDMLKSSRDSVSKMGSLLSKVSAFGTRATRLSAPQTNPDQDICQ